MLIIEHHTSLAQQRKRLGGQLELHDVCARLRIGRIVGPVTRATVSDHLVDLAHVLAARGRDPRRVATRVSERTAENASSSLLSAAVSCGKLPSARATRSRSCAVRVA
jgi:hypothetical protein